MHLKVSNPIALCVPQDESLRVDICYWIPLNAISLRQQRHQHCLLDVDSMRFDSGPKSHKNVYYILDCDAVKSQKSGCNQAIAIPCEEVYVPDGPPVLPSKAAADEALALFREPKPEDLAVIEVPFSELPSDAKASTRHEYITLDRLIKYGASPSCTGCEKVTGRLTSV